MGSTTNFLKDSNILHPSLTNNAIYTAPYQSQKDNTAKERRGGLLKIYVEMSDLFGVCHVSVIENKISKKSEKKERR